MDWLIPIVGAAAGYFLLKKSPVASLPPASVTQQQTVAAQAVLKEAGVPSTPKTIAVAVAYETAIKAGQEYVKLEVDFRPAYEARAKAVADALAEYEKRAEALNASTNGGLTRMTGGEWRAKEWEWVGTKKVTLSTAPALALASLQAVRNRAINAADEAQAVEVTRIAKAFERTKDEWRAKGYVVDLYRSIGVSLMLPGMLPGGVFTSMEGSSVWYAHLPGVTPPNSGLMVSK